MSTASWAAPCEIAWTNLPWFRRAYLDAGLAAVDAPLDHATAVLVRRESLELLQDLEVHELREVAVHLVDDLLHHVVPVAAHHQLANAALHLRQKRLDQIRLGRRLLYHLLHYARRVRVHAQRQNAPPQALRDLAQPGREARRQLHELYYHRCEVWVGAVCREVREQIGEGPFEKRLVFLQALDRRLRVRRTWGVLLGRVPGVPSVVFHSAPVHMVDLFLWLREVFGLAVLMALEVLRRAGLLASVVGVQRDRVHSKSVRRAGEEPVVHGVRPARLRGVLRRVILLVCRVWRGVF